MPELEDQILALVNDKAYAPVKPRVIAKRLQLDREDYVNVRRAVKRLARAGKLDYGKNHVVYPEGKHKRKKTAAREVVGRFDRAAGGFGFVRPLDKKHGDRSHDVFVPANRTQDAASGDKVLVHISSERGRDQRIRGRIIEVIERRTHQFVGTYFEDADHGFVAVDGGLFKKGVLVGDPGARNVMPDDKVVIEMVRFPTAYRHGEAVITKVLGERGKPGVDTQLIIHEFALPTEFPEEALEDARQVAERFDESIGPERTDFSETTVITIDPFDARDFDDAISLRRLDNGHWELGVHIADVSHFVRPQTALDDVAKDRATSVYLPGRVIPMLPEIISNNLASLQPDCLRYTKSVIVEFTPDGSRVQTEAKSGAIRSARRFTYEEVDKFLADRAAWRKKLTAPVHGLLSNMHELAMILRTRRMDRGAIELTMPEVVLEFDRHGRVTGAHETENTESHQIIEEFMLAANEAVAEMLHDRTLIFLRRLHENPDPRKLKALTEFAKIIGFDVDSLESRFEIKRLLELAKDSPKERAVNFSVLRSMKKAVYGPEELGHYALHSKHYCHFTSPIRRYPDLTVHRLIDALNVGTPPAQNFEHLAVLGEHCSEREQRAERADRELTKLKLLMFLSQRIGEQMDAVVTGVEAYGMFVQGVDFPAEGLVHIDSMEDDLYDFDDRAFALIGRHRGGTFTLGDTVRVEIAHVDLDQRELDLKLLGGGGGKRSHKGRSTKKTSDRGRAGRSSPRGSEQKKKGKRKGKKSGRDRSKDRKK